MGDFIYIKLVHCVIFVHLVSSAEKIILPLLQSVFLLRYLVHEANLVHNFSYYVFISFLYVFGATTCPSSGETTVSMPHLVLVTPKQVSHR